MTSFLTKASTLSIPKTSWNINYLVISDIHLGHPENKTEDIIRNLIDYIENFPKALDILFIAGDLTDRLLRYPSEEAFLLTEWACRLLRYCQRNVIKLRILRGTTSHDWGQSEVFNRHRALLELDVDLKYADELSIEVMDDLNLSILYVPDELHSDNRVIFRDVKELLKKHQLSQVDIAIMHGQFTYQLPPVVKEMKHDENSYLSVVKYFIHIGHIHIHSVYDRIIAQGSFDRLAHGEENPKGGVFVSFKENDYPTWQFIINKQAKIFKTISVSGKDYNETLDYLDKVIRKIPINSHIRIKGPKTHPIFQEFMKLKGRYGFYKITRDHPDEIKRTIQDDIGNENYVPSVEITPSNLEDIILYELEKSYPCFTPRQKDVLKKQLAFLK